MGSAVRVTAVILGLATAAVGPALADGLLDETPVTTNDVLTTLFPNWKQALAAEFALTECTDANCPGCVTGNIQSLTIVNYGTASGGAGGDISAVYFNLNCGKTSIWGTLTFAGNWFVSGGPHAAWTWSGPAVWGGDPNSSCGGLPDLAVYVDVGSCPTAGASVVMGLGYNDIANPTQPGGLWDTCGYQVPSYPEALKTGNLKLIQYVTKTSDVDYASPGDTVTYTIFYGRPGGPAISNFIVFDSMPTYTHYLQGSGVPAPDLGWDPDVGPPMRLKWTLPGVATTAGGPTAMLTYQATVDWGNLESFEAGSGDVAAPEGARLGNIASVEALGSGCAAAQLSPPTSTVVRRYIIWKMADQDLLFASRNGYPDDEITYSIFVANVSTSKTWWDVAVWDTVPSQLTSWTPGAGGFWDPCTSSWTMTPTGGCSPSGPGYLVNPSRTLLTWTLGVLPPGATFTLQWKARVQAAGVVVGSMASGKVSVMALGQPGTFNGTGHARQPRTFYHEALIVLRTTYYSYVGQAADSTSCVGLNINFYPLNQATNFELRKLENYGAGFATNGGKSASITLLNGTCLGGFADGGYGGCGVERAPAQYNWVASCSSAPNATLYKLTSNAPLLWILMPEVGGGGDAWTFIPASNLSFSGFNLYSFRRSVSGSTTPGWGESWTVFNTSVDPTGAHVPGQTTTVHFFNWDPIQRLWVYMKTADLDPEAVYMPWAGLPAGSDGHYRVISSDSKLTVYQDYGTIGDPNITFAYNDHGNIAPNAEYGTLAGKPGLPSTFYTLANNDPSSNNFIVGNLDSVQPATFRLYRYAPADPTLATSGIPATLCGTSGSWQLMGIRTIAPGLAGATNPFVGGNGNDTITTGVGSTANAWKVEWVAGGNIQVMSGTNIWYAWSGGNVMHAIDGNPTGLEFWLQMATGQAPNTWAVLVFCPSTGMAINGYSPTGFSATYTTDGVDQCVMFTNFSKVAYGSRINYSFKVLPGGTQAEAVAMRHQTEYREKFFTAPFVATGVHYDVIAPPIVFSGQPFWITVVVVLGTGTTKVDYCGTSSFTSTDPGATMVGSPMDLYNFTWTSSTACSSAPDENGLKLFLNVVLTTIGDQTIEVNDTVDGSVNGVTTVDVVGVDIKLDKRPRFTVAASGDTVQFQICWSNYSSASAFSFTITDAVPSGMTYLPEVPSAMLCSMPAGVTADVAYSTVAQPTPPATFTTTTAGPPPNTTQWLRWTIRNAYVRTTGCVCFRVTVN